MTRGVLSWEMLRDAALSRRCCVMQSGVVVIAETNMMTVHT